VRAVRAF